METLIKTAYEGALDVLFPPTCIGCEGDGNWLCYACQSRMSLFHHAACARCGSLKHEHDCKGEWPLASVTVCGPYADPSWRRLLTSFKYRSARCLEKAFRDVLTSFRQQYQDPWPWANRETMLIGAVAADERRKRERGFDHGEWLADLVHEALIPWGTRTPLLTRVKAVPANASLTSDLHRLLNIRGAFAAIREIRQPVLLVDDVLTTGATAVESAKVLLAAGAPEVHLFTFATGK